ncbi:hypothetical protein [Suttonella ornithocola]|uniref:Uncharacterized protein n=1 Tax=Suttonella ornithocola TaxID=279832 RepID=A0A380N006_9GAMM|nr:hypothetical protein [Suttonella ornithocola]SUO97463.1 Uncharacterised protein [Suttonella ornithocola]
MKKIALMLALAVAMPDAAEITIAYNSDPVSLDPMQELSAGSIQISTMLKAQYFPERDKCEAGIALMGI